jgi:hypothetical protein
MSILEDCVFSSTSYHGRGMFVFDRISDEQKLLLKTITKRQRRKFISHRLIPRQVLQILWDLDYLPGENGPDQGMRIPVLLKVLREGKYRDETNRARGILLHDKIDQEEYPSKIITNETLIQCGQSKKIFVLVSNEREKQGTIFK